MNLNSKQTRVPLQVLLMSILCIGLLSLVYMVAFRRSPVDAEAQQKANSTKTALALTADSLLGPFPTSTAPTPTASDTPTLTPTLPTATSTVTRTPSPTRTFIPTFTPRTIEAHSTTTPLPIRTAQSTSTNAAIVPTNPPPTDPLPTDPPPPPPPTDPPQATQPPIIVIPPILQTVFPQ